MKAVLIRIQPKWVEKISNGEKTIEARKTKPKINTPFKVYIYCTYGNPKDNYCLGKRGKVIGEFVCDRIVDGKAGVQEWAYICENSNLSCKEIYNYCGEDEEGETKYCYGWHISNLVIYDKPKELSEFYLQCEEYGKTGTIDTPKKCKKCRYQYTWNLASKCIIDGLKPITRPPQSWCYVEKGE